MQSDVDFLGMAPGPCRPVPLLTIGGHLARLDGLLYGGTAIAAPMAAAGGG